MSSIVFDVLRTGLGVTARLVSIGLITLVAVILYHQVMEPLLSDRVGPAS